VATEIQEQFHSYLPAMVEDVSKGKAEFFFVRPPLPEEPTPYGMPAKKVPSDVHPVPCELVLGVMRKSMGASVLLLDGSIFLDVSDIRNVVESAQKALVIGGGSALPIRYNFCPDGSLSSFCADGSPRFEYGILPRDIFELVLQKSEAIYTGDVLLSEIAVRHGLDLIQSKQELNRFPERIILIRGRAARKVDGIQCPDDICMVRDYHRRFQGKTYDSDMLFALRTAMIDAELSLLSESLDPNIQERLLMSLKLLKPGLLEEIKHNPIRETIPKCMSSIEPYMDIFECRLDLLKFLILLGIEKIRKSISLGDREFWSAFEKYTWGDGVLLSKLLYLKV
jgi:hypothetical protein